ncbi:hypothetical protein EMPS_09799 [Entomortierella parvispora]|uniref:RING-type domain-containing protein n=1 Tax=Entomortierella parvispora TaxID=205924 RepID=A0A9P3M0Y1_9FUNG|nr:hypothetical protein EMPS_09799 [Entomortierella parvispora]
MSQVHYKFKSSKDYDSATFDGHSISVFDLKKEILIAKGLKGPDDLALTHAESGEEYYDDAALIPRNTSILVARVPARPGRGGAQRYLEGSGPTPRGGGMTRNVFERPGQNPTREPMGGSQVYKNTTSLLPQDGPPPPAVDMSNMTEEERMKHVFEQSASYWDKTQEGMASAPFRPLAKFQGATRNTPAAGGKPAGGPGAPGAPQSGQSSFNRPAMDQQQRPPPNTYVCYRCGKKGEHWIQFCPTNNDKSFEPIGIKKTTGIPRSFLKTVESDTLQSKKGVMVTQDGNLVVATTNDYEWKKFHEKSKGTLTSDEAYATAPVPDSMRCPICHLILKGAVKAPCCGTNFCDECIRNYLVQPPKGEEPFKCQHCRRYLVPDQLIPSIDLRHRVEQHLRDWAKNRRNETDDMGSSAPAANPHVDSSHMPDRSGSNMEGQDNSAKPKRRLSNDSQDNGGDHWKNKRPNNVNNNYGGGNNTGGYNQQNFNRNRPTESGPGVANMGNNMNGPNGMADGIPPVLFDMMQQDPAMFMDPAFFNGPNGVPPYMMQPGFIPPYGGMPGAPMGGPEMWGMGQGLPGLPPMGPGFPTPRIGFGDNSAGRGRGRGRGNWNDNHPSQPPMAPGGRGRGYSSPAPSGPSQGSGLDEPPTKPAALGDSDRKNASGQNRFDDRDDDMSEVPKGPRGARRPSFDDDIPKGPRAGVEDDIPKGPRADNLKSGSDTYDIPKGPRVLERESSSVRSLSPRNRSTSKARSDRAGRDTPERDSSRHRESRGGREYRDRENDREGGRDRDRDRRDYRERDRDYRSREPEDRDRQGGQSWSSSRSSRNDRDRDHHSQRREESSRKEDRQDDYSSSSSRNDSRRRSSDHKDTSSSLSYNDDRGSSRRNQQASSGVTSSSSPSRGKSSDPQKDYEMRRQSAFGSSSSRESGSQSGGYQTSNGRRGYGREQDADEDEDGDYQQSNHRAQEENDDVVHFRKRGAGSGSGSGARGASDVVVTGLVSSSARERERERRERERERERDRR